MRTISEEQFKKQYGEETLNQFGSQPVQEPGYLQRVGTGLKETFTGLKEDIGTQQEAFAQPLAEGGAPVKQVEALARGGLRTVGALAEAAFVPIMEAPGVKQATAFVGEKLAETTPMQKYAEWSQKHPEAAKDIENVLDIAGVFGVAKGVQTGVKVGVKGAEAGIAGAKAGLQGTAQRVSQATSGIKGAVAPLVQEAKRIPSRVQTNLATKQAVQEGINRLPSKVARQAAQDGIEVGDVKFIYNIPKTQKAPLKKLAKIVKDFSEGKTKTNPIEAVGKPIISRIEQLESAKVKIGKKLGEVSKNLGDVTTEELELSLFENLKKVPGLSGLKIHTPESLATSGLSDAELALAHITSRGKILDFSDTVLASPLSKSEQKAIQNIFSEAVKSGTGKSKHLLRQELFEILGGKKKALTNLTDTQERAFNAVRKSLSDVLESKNSQYKALSNQYRKIAQPLQDIRGYMKKVVGADEDILDMYDGLLARRLTSAAKSNPEIKAVLNAMDKATAVAGKTRLSVETLQDFYNILEKYYDIAPKTGFQSQVRQGVEKAIGGPVSFVGEQVKGFLGETSAVRQKALEKVLEEVFR